MSFKAKTLAMSETRCDPKPPSNFGKHTSLQATFALLWLLGEPLQRKAEHKLSISSKQTCGRQKAKDQKFLILAMTEFINCRRPASAKARPTEEPIPDLIYQRLVV